MTSQPVLPQSPPVRNNDVRWAWICTALIPVGLVVAIVVGSVIASALGYDSGRGDLAPLGIALAAGIPQCWSACCRLVSRSTSACGPGVRATSGGSFPPSSPASSGSASSGSTCCPTSSAASSDDGLRGGADGARIGARPVLV